MEAAAQREGKGNKAKTKSAFYRLQREHAEESGDQKTTDKIYGKLGRKSHNVDSSRGDKAILGAAPFLPEAAAGLGEMAAARAAGGLARKAIEGSVQRLKTPVPVKKALESKIRLSSGSTQQAGRAMSASGPKAVTGKPPKRLDSIGKPKPKALGSSGHSEFEAELSRMSKKSVPKSPKTFNRNGSARAEGRQKSDRNPVSKRKKKGE
jgi:hypothetical protein